MHNRRKHFLQILEIEMDDLKEDIDLLMEQCEDEKKEDKLTDYVFLNNMALFRNEEVGLEHFKTILQNIDPDAFPDLDSLILHCKEMFLDKIKACGLAPFIDILVERKIKKVARYVRQ